MNMISMAEHKWAAPQHQDVPVYAAASLPPDQIGGPEGLDAWEPVWIDRLAFDQIAELEIVKAFAVARSDVAVCVEMSWQGRLQHAWVPRRSVTLRRLAPRRD
ncbi:hypothetical protein [Curtobacterium flaccumfaciens]|uniref:hypothetical protein n=1 Tax=Curtobacterium flaccumfaciens TaxID=2035 RepID=UPI00217E7D2D|nr:hypothetical protein [Curtobacterium flaccumfaciens]